MFNLFRLRLGIAFLLLLFPFASKADAINPLINVFTKKTALSASILTVVIILIESSILRRLVKSVPFRIHLWRTTLFNTISSAAGSIVTLLFFKEKLDWEMSALYIPMFFLTLLTETPAIKYLYQRDNLSWLRSIKLSCAINITSYILLFCAQFGLFITYIFYAEYADKLTIKKWTDTSILNDESGYIYTVKNLNNGWPEKNALSRYDVSHKKWATIDLGFKDGFNSREWDIRNNIIACIEKIDNQDSKVISILNIDNQSKISEIKSKGGDMRISPDLHKLAVLEFESLLGAPRDDVSHFMLGSATKLRIYDIKSGELLFESPRIALNEGLVWLSNSTEVIFASFRDEALLYQKEDSYSSMGYGLAYSKHGQFPIDLFIYNITSNSVRLLTEGTQPNTITSTNQITFLKAVGKDKYELWKSDLNLTNREILINEYFSTSYAISQNGRKFLMKLPHKAPLGNNSFLVVSKNDSSDKKLIIEPSYNSTFRWIEK